jgi:putative ABC transport system permease protein
VVNSLARKRLRDLWQLRGQVLAIALVNAVGVAMLVMSMATLHSLQRSRDRYYQEHAFADVFVSLKRAPEAVAARLREIDGVVAVDTRVIGFGRGEIAGFGDPIQIQAVSIPEYGPSRLDRLRVLAGRAPGGDERDALAISDAFAEAHGLRPGDRIVLTLHGHRGVFRIVGIAGSPEFIAQVPPQSSYPDPRRFAIAWMPRPALEAAVDMRDAFNSVAMRLQPGARREAVLIATDRLLARYGGSGAIVREDQLSHHQLEEEFRQLTVMVQLFPAVFLGVAAFVLYVVLGRLIAGQREQIGTLKAFGYSEREVARHYAGYALLIGGMGALLGIALGAWLGSLLAKVYRDFYRLPFLDFTLPAATLWLAFAVSLGCALAGALLPVRRASRLPPAEAMRTELPSRGDARRLDRYAVFRRLRAPHRLIARSLLRRPLRTLLTCLGLSLGTAVMMLGRFHHDSIGVMVDQQFRLASRHDLEVTFVEPVSQRALSELVALPGVIAAEPLRAVPVILRHRAASHRTAVIGLQANARLRRALDENMQAIEPPPSGVIITDRLAQMLDAHPGDLLEFETLEGRRRTLSLRLSGLVGEPFGVQAYLPLDTLNRLLGDGDRMSGAVLAVDAGAMPGLLAQLQRRPQVAAIEQRLVTIRNFYDSTANVILVFTLVATAFGVVITAGVVYSSARVALSERARDLASLRVLGFTRPEVVYLLLGELALLTALALPLGYALGHALIALMVLGFNSDLFRIPHYVSPATYAFAGLSTVLAAALSARLVRRQVRRLDLIGVLKARD